MVKINSYKSSKNAPELFVLSEIFQSNNCGNLDVFRLLISPGEKVKFPNLGK